MPVFLKPLPLAATLLSTPDHLQLQVEFDVHLLLSVLRFPWKRWTSQTEESLKILSDPDTYKSKQIPRRNHFISELNHLTNKDGYLPDA